MFTFITLALATVASVSGLAIPRDGKPATYGDWLENYDVYHARYVAVGCTGKQGTPFFESCCRPMLANQILEKSRPAECIPTANPSKTVSATPSPSSTDASDDDDWCYEGDADCDCVNDAELSTSAAPTTPVETPEPRPNTTVQPTTVPAATPTQSTNNGSGKTETGHATFFYQNNTPGACGKVHQDSDSVAAITGAFYGKDGQPSDMCGKTLQVTRPSNGKTIFVTVADLCPTCISNGSLDLSMGAFKQLGTEDEGMFPIEWKVIN